MMKVILVIVYIQRNIQTINFPKNACNHAKEKIFSIILGIPALVIKDQENPNFSAFDRLESLSNDPIFDPGRLGKRSDGTEIRKLYAKPEVEGILGFKRS